MTLAATEREAPTDGRAPRGADGRYTTFRSPLVYFEIVREGAVVAAQRHPDPFKDPATVSLREWNAARAALAPRFGHVPRAHEICRQLRDRDGKSWPWRDLLALVFDETRNPKKTWEERLSEPEREIADQHVYFALTFVAGRLGKRTLLPREYEGERERLLEHARRGGTSVNVMKQRMPTRGQIETHAGTWDRALEFARLEPRPTRVSKVDAIEAVLTFLERHGYLPAEVELIDEARRQGVSLKRPRDRSWDDVIEQAKREACARPLPEPPPYGTRPCGPKRGANQPGEPIRTRGTKYSHVQVLESVREFQAALPTATSATNTRWVEWRRGKKGVPSLNAIVRHGGLKALLREASLPDWRERAEEWDRAAIQSVGRGRPRSDKGDRLRAVIAARGEASSRELEEALGWPVNDVRYYLRQLKKEGRIVTTHPHQQAKNQRYQATALTEPVSPQG